MTPDLPRVPINTRVREDLRDVLNEFVGWLNRRYPVRHPETQQRILWNQSTAMELILENTHYWNEFVDEDEATVRAER